MAFIEINNVRIAGISAGVPKKMVDNLHAEEKISDQYDNEQFVIETGVRQRRIDEHLTTSDLCFPAAKSLISDLGWQPEEIDAIILVTQLPDFLAPATACIIQDKLGCSKDCIAFDVELGCSGWVYGMSILSSLMQTGNIQKGLLLAGDGCWNYEGAAKYSGALFGHAGTVTALEYREDAHSLKFHLGTDGSGYNALWVKGGGARNPLNKNSLVEKTEKGEIFTDVTSRMNGMDVFSFGISTAPKSVKKLADRFSFDYNEMDYFIFHQANLKMNQIITKKLKLSEAKTPSCLDEFGNTSSASIPLTMVTRLAKQLQTTTVRMICCGFGIGLSWGTLMATTDKIVVSDLVEVESDEHIL